MCSDLRSFAIALLLASSAIAAAQPVPDEPTQPAPDQPTRPQPPPSPPPPAKKEPEPLVLPPGRKVEPLIRSGIAPELTLAGGVRVAAGDMDHVRRFDAKARAGLTLYSEPNFLVVGLVGEIGPLDSSSLGFEASYINMITGLWGQGAVLPFDTTGGTILEATFGYALFGLEYQRRVSGPQKDEQSLTINLQVPLGVLRVILQ